mmetsp:Transcript_14004/g.31886  ORF Transcript_14004/g.31886 Transcript_14004/m.31886 type:complete len:581 (-) Transcript_14004:71-1813(-)
MAVATMLSDIHSLLALAGCSLLVAAHGHAMGPSLANDIAVLAGWFQERCSLHLRQTDDQVNQERIAKEIDGARVAVYMTLAKRSVHALFLYLIWELTRYSQSTISIFDSFRLAFLFAAYLVDLLTAAGVWTLTAGKMRLVRCVHSLCIAGIFLSSYSSTGTGLDSKAAQSAQASCILRSLASLYMLIMMESFTPTLMSFMAEVLNWYAQPSLVSGTLLPMNITLLSVQMMAGVAFGMCIKWYFRTGLRVRDTQSLLHGFRQILKGTCDGDLLLDHNLCISGAATSLQRIIGTSENLCGKQFVQFLQSPEDTTKFLSFIEASSKNMAGASASPELAATPSGLRVALATKQGKTVSVDIFHAPMPDLFGSPEPYHLLAMVEDSDFCPPAPDAESMLNFLKSPNKAQAAPSSAPTSRVSFGDRADQNEIILAMQELEQVALLLDTQTPEFDILEAHLKFVRFPDDASLKLNLPTLKQLARPTDWHKLQGKLQKFIARLVPGQEDLRKDLHSQRFRIPGAPRKYLKTKTSQLSCANGPGTLQHHRPLLYLLLQDFDKEDCQLVPDPPFQGVEECQVSEEEDGDP